jgi:hypothetical protein
VEPVNFAVVIFIPLIGATVVVISKEASAAKAPPVARVRTIKRVISFFMQFSERSRAPVQVFDEPFS